MAVNGHIGNILADHFKFSVQRKTFFYIFKALVLCKLMFFYSGDKSKLMCWACSCSYKRALAKTKQSDPARHSR